MTSLPPRIKPKLKSAPRIRQIYWCDFPLDAQLPEFWKKRPVIILSKTATLSGTVLAIPCSTKDQMGNKWAHKLTTTINGDGDSWAICDKLGTFAVSRLSAEKACINRLGEEEFAQILRLIRDFLPQLPSD